MKNNLIFNGWNPVTKTMLRNIAVKDGNMVVPVQTSGNDSWDAEFEIVPEVEILFFSNFYDTQGGRIFEGDVIDFENGYKDYMIKEEGSFRLSNNNYIENYTHGKLIGNIYENPELLNQLL